jgi:probable sporulation protein (polysaccharide deacetylase family)
MIIYSVKFPKKRLIIIVSSVLLVACCMLFYHYDTLTTTSPIYRGRADSKQIAFACNLVWGTEYIPKMLKIFDAEDVKITFFIGGDWAQKNPDVLKQIYHKGHEIGNHGYSHKHHKQLNRDQNNDEILKTEKVIQDILGVKTVLFAPPYGEFNDTTVEVADSLGYKTIMWTIDTIDWKNPGADYIFKKVTKKAENGAIVLMHPTVNTVDVLPSLIKALKESGFKVTTVGRVL